MPPPTPPRLDPRHAVALAVAMLASSWAPAGLATPAAAPAREEVRFPAGDTSLAATIHRAPGAAIASLVIAPGSGAFGRDFPFYTRLADTLARAGITVLVYDKRGVGASGGRYHEVPDLGLAADDLAAALRFLRARPGVDPARAGVLGVSQGGWTAPVVATRDPAPAFYVGISTPGVSTLEQNLHERTRQLVEDGWLPPDVAEITALRRQLWTYYRTGDGHEALNRSWQAARTRPWFARTNWGGPTPTLADLNESQQRAFRGAGFFDPAAALARLRVPVLLVFGARDRHIDVDRALAAHRAAFAASGLTDTTIVVLPDDGHLLQPVAGDEECVNCPHDREQTTRSDPAAFRAITGWLTARFVKPR